MKKSKIVLIIYLYYFFYGLGYLHKNLKRSVNMNQTYNIYCDESCHLENDNQQAMVLGAVWCEIAKVKEINIRIREIKNQFGLSSHFEIKWTKVSPSKLQFYKEIMDYFFDDDDLHFRALIVSDKSKLQHKVFRQSHDEWYYKMYFDMLKVILNPTDHYRIYLDIKDTQGALKVKKLHDVLSNNMYDFSRKIIEWIQTVRSHEIEMLQLTDLLIGVIAYVNRMLKTSPAKNELVDRMRKRSGYDLTKTTLYLENKLNIFRWQAKEVIK